MSGGGGTNTSSGVPGWMQPYFEGELAQGSKLQHGPGPQYYPGQQVAPLNPLQEQGLSSIQGTASGPSASQGALDANRFETSGALLNPSMNPYLRGTFDQGANAIQNHLSSEFAGSGRNIQASAPVQSDEMNNLATQLYGGAYGQGLDQMTRASGLAPMIDAGTYQPGQELLGAGSGLQNQTQNLINANMNAWNYKQQLPYNQLSWYSSLLGQGASPFHTQSTTGSQGSPWASAGGGALTGAATGAELGSVVPGLGTGIGAGVGAVAGGLMGYFGH